MKNLIRLSAVSLLFVATGAYAAADGFYMDANAGWGVAKYAHDDFQYMSSASFQDNNFAFGGDFGYQFSELLGAELGYTHMQGISVNDISLSGAPGGLTTLGNGNIALNIIDFALKGMLPLKHGFGLNAKLGAAYVKTSIGDGLDQPSLGADYKSSSKTLPEIGVGASYDFNPHTQLGLNFKQIIRGGNIPNIYFATFNLGYHFG